MATVLITGANRGIGLELARQLRARGDTVLGACRNRSPELAALGVEVIDGVDVGDDGCGERLQAALGERPLDVLVNNAGVLGIDTLDQLDLGGVRRQLEINALGPLRVTTALRRNLPRGAKVAIITSRMGSIADNTSGGFYGYRMSKAAVNMVGANLAQDLRGDGIAVALLHPGMVATEMTGQNGIPAPESVAGLIKRIDELTLETSGRFLHMNGQQLPW